MPKPPPGRRRREWKSVEERCQACKMLGGPEPACLGDAVVMAAYKKEKHRDCPRVELDPANVLPAQLCTWVSDEQLRPLAPRFLELSAPHLSSDDERAILVRVQRTLGNPDVIDAIYPERKKLREKAEKARG